jgi:type I restriction enzyme M protein
MMIGKKMPRLVAELHAQFAESAKLEQAIKANLRRLGLSIAAERQNK